MYPSYTSYTWQMYLPAIVQGAPLPQPFTSSSGYSAAPTPPPGEPGPLVLTFQLGPPVHQSPLFMSYASTTPSTIHSQGQG